MHWQLLYPSTYLGAADLNGQDRTLTIRTLNVEELKGTDGKSQKVPLLYFTELDEEGKKKGLPADKIKRMVLNKTNARTIAGLYGNDIEGWRGKRVTLFSASVTAFGEMKDALRIRPRVPAANDPAAKEAV